VVVTHTHTNTHIHTHLQGASNEQSGKKQVEWETEVAVHNGSSGALFNSICGLVDAGDEVIVLGIGSCEQYFYFSFYILLFMLPTHYTLH
jgi:hypothetical protein